MQAVLGLLWIVLTIVLGVLAIIGFGKTQKMFNVLKDTAPSIFRDPNSAQWNNPSDALSFWGYILAKKYNELNDLNLIKRCANLRILFFIYTILFIGIIVTQVLLGVYK